MMFLWINEIMNQMHNVFFLFTNENIFRIIPPRSGGQAFLGRRDIENRIAFALR